MVGGGGTEQKTTQLLPRSCLGKQKVFYWVLLPRITTMGAMWGEGTWLLIMDDTAFKWSETSTVNSLMLLDWTAWAMLPLLHWVLFPPTFTQWAALLVFFFWSLGELFYFFNFPFWSLILITITYRIFKIWGGTEFEFWPQTCLLITLASYFNLSEPQLSQLCNRRNNSI